MRFANPSALNLIWLIIGVGLFFIWAYKHRKKVLAKFANEEVLSALTASFSAKKHRFKIFILTLALVAIMIALMRPQWGFEWKEVKRQGVDIFIALDVSKSMLAQDIKPSRLERAKFAIKDLVKKLQGDRIGLISFAGTAFIQCPLTIDYSAFLFVLDGLGIDTIPRGGTSISSALKEAVDGYEGGLKKYKALIVITDGEDHEGDPLKLAEQAKEEGINIFTIGIGTEEGELIQVINDKGERVFLKDKSGNVVKTRLNEGVLKQIALKTEGSYVRATSLDFGLEWIYDKKISKMEKKELTGKMAKFFDERFQIPLIIALLLIVLDTVVTVYKKEG
jgi:Ca-activated chloride channel family protein